MRDGAVIGSVADRPELHLDKYFHGRPSATNTPDPKDPTKTVDAPYNAANSSGSNLGPTSQALVDRVKGDIESWRKEGVTGPIPGRRRDHFRLGARPAHLAGLSRFCRSRASPRPAICRRTRCAPSSRARSKGARSASSASRASTCSSSTSRSTPAGWLRHRIVTGATGRAAWQRVQAFAALL